MTDKELKDIAISIHDGKIFTDRHCKEAISSSFIVIALGGLSKMRKRERDNIGLIYEYINKAGPMAINGNPVFFSMRKLTIRQTERMFKFYDEYEKLQF